MENVIVIYHPNREMRARQAALNLNLPGGKQITFTPNKPTSIPLEDWEKLKGDSFIKNLLQRKALERVGVDSEAIADLPPEAASEAIAEITSVERLVELATNATDIKLQDAIKTRAGELIEQLNNINFPAPKAEDISKLSIEEAKPIIAAETNLEHLNNWLSDSRSGIRDLVQKRIKEVEKNAT